MIVAIALLLLAAAPAHAHRLDEYLQAAVLDFERDRINLRLSLTPGVSVAPQILETIDSDRNGVASATEQRRYADRVRRDLELRVDGTSLPLRLAAICFPPLARLKSGTGDILLSFVAPSPPGRSHVLDLRNGHQSAIAIYLVNTLQPSDRAVAILGQHRNTDQSSYRLEYALGPLINEAAAAPASVQSREAMASTPVLATYFWHGITHILTGYDHLLFIAALVLGAATLWDLVAVVTAFTIAHSITLSLAATGWVHVPGYLVEPVIAASIVAVAAQNIIRPDRSRGRSRLAIAFVFGLFHGLGFAGGLLDIMHRLPNGTILVAILGFSIGIETGNQLVLLPLFGLVNLAAASRGLGSTARRTIQIAGSSAICAAGIYYLIAASLEATTELSR